MDYSQHRQLELRRKFWKFFGAQINILDPATNQPIGFIKMKAFKLKDDIRIYSDPSMQQEVLRINARKVMQMSREFDVVDSQTNTWLIGLRRRGLKSAFVRDHWDLTDSQGNQYGYVQETSSSLAILRRWLSFFSDIAGLIFAFVPETFDVVYAPAGAQPQLAAKITHRKNPIIVKMNLDTTQAQVMLDMRINLAVASLLSIKDAAKNN